jgi:hypothetical protein
MYSKHDCIFAVKSVFMSSHDRLRKSSHEEVMDIYAEDYAFL